MSRNGYVLEALNISKSFPGVRALNDVTLQVSKGEVHALIGENGAGKSTLIKIITGVYQADAGRVLVDGADAAIRSVKDSQRLGINCIYQDPEFAQDLSVAENIFMGSLPRNAFGLVRWKDLYAKAGELFELFGISLDARKTLRELSVAHRQMVEIVKTFSRDSRIVIMDEPTTALTSEEIEKLFGLLRKLIGQGLSIVYISHRMDEIFDIADRATILRDGSRIDTVEVAKVNHDQVIELMVGRPVNNLFPKLDGKIGGEVLRVEGLTKKGSFSDVSFSVRRGEIVGIAGLIGSGRGELAKAIYGMEALDSGKILVAERPVRIEHPGAAISHGIAQTVEERKSQGLFLEHSVKANLNVSALSDVATLGFVSRRKEKEKTASLIECLSINTPSQEQLVKFLSGGNQQRVVIGKCLATNPKLMILNEPTKGIDVGAKAEVYLIVGGLVKDGSTGVLLFSTEIMELAAVCDRVIVLFKGKAVAELRRGTPEWDENIQKTILSYCITGRKVQAA
jgi:ABC-type sugar transport system ATPase subunit